MVAGKLTAHICPEVAGLQDHTEQGGVSMPWLQWNGNGGGRAGNCVENLYRVVLGEQLAGRVGGAAVVEVDHPAAGVFLLAGGEIGDATCGIHGVACHVDGRH